MFFLLLFLGAVALVLAYCGLRRTARVTLAMLIVLFIAVGCGLLPRLMLRDLQAGYSGSPLKVWQPRSAIIVLGGGQQRVPDEAPEVPLTAYGRVLKGVELYLECKHAGGACVVIVSGGDPVRSGTPEARIYGKVLLESGVAAADLVLETNSLNTWQNAQYCAAWLSAHPQDEVVLVTSGFHLRRGTLYFTHFGMRPIPVRGDFVDAIIGPIPTSQNFLLMDIALHEYLGLARYHVYNLMGWNVQAAKPGSI